MLILKDLVNKKSSCLIVVKGRRRIEKSRLLEEFGQFFKKTFEFSGLPASKETR